jgi:hypothetical protein
LLRQLRTLGKPDAVGFCGFKSKQRSVASRGSIQTVFLASG